MFHTVELEIQGWGPTGSFKKLFYRCWCILKISKHQPKVTYLEVSGDKFQIRWSLTMETQQGNYINAVSARGNQEDCPLCAKCPGYLQYHEEMILALTHTHTHLKRSMNVHPCSLHVSRWRHRNWTTCEISTEKKWPNENLVYYHLWSESQDSSAFLVSQHHKMERKKKMSPWLPSILFYFSSRDTKLF